MNTIGERLKQTRLERNLTQSEVARRAGVSQGTIGNLESGTREKPRELNAIARAVEVNPDWLESGRGPKHLSEVADRQFPYVASTIPGRTLAPQLVSWEKVLQGVELQELFVVALNDNSCSPEHPPGTEIIWSTTKQPHPGSLVLLRDRVGQLHVREYRQGPEPGQWFASAINRAFASFDSRVDQLTIVAVAKYRELP